MPRNYSAAYKSTLAQVDAPEAPIVLAKITHAGIAGGAVYVVNDTSDLIVGGLTYVAAPFRLNWPSDVENQLPRASLSVDNIGRELMYWIESSNGGEGATITFKEVLRSNPTLVEWQITMNLFNIKATPRVVTAELGYENLMGRPAVARYFRPNTAPGLF